MEPKEATPEVDLGETTGDDSDVQVEENVSVPDAPVVDISDDDDVIPVAPAVPTTSHEREVDILTFELESMLRPNPRLRSVVVAVANVEPRPSTSRGMPPLQAPEPRPSTSRGAPPPAPTGSAPLASKKRQRGKRGGRPNRPSRRGRRGGRRGQRHATAPSFAPPRFLPAAHVSNYVDFAPFGRPGPEVVERVMRNPPLIATPPPRPFFPSFPPPMAPIQFFFGTPPFSPIAPPLFSAPPSFFLRPPFKRPGPPIFFGPPPKISNRDSVLNQPRIPKSVVYTTPDGRPICYACKRVDHIHTVCPVVEARNAAAAAAVRDSSRDGPAKN